MKLTKLFSLVAFIACLSGTIVISQGACAGDRAGNGGEFNEMRLIETGYNLYGELIQLYKENNLPNDIKPHALFNKLRKMRIAFVASPTVDGLPPRSAVNYPCENLIEVSAEDFKREYAKTDSFEQFVLHELLPVINIDDFDYLRSIDLMKRIRESRAQRQKTTVAENPNPQPAQPTLLYTRYDDNEKTGMRWHRAKEVCETQKSFYNNQYYYVYCDYIKKVWEEEYRSPHYPYIVDYERHLWGLQVWGLGSNGDLVWQVVASSRSLLNDMDSRYFRTEITATVACRERLMAEQQYASTKYYRSTCRTLQNYETGRYYYEIVSQNPLLNSWIE